MKKLLYLFLIALFITSCTKSNDAPPNELGGDTNLPMNDIGNTYNASIYINDEYVNLNESVVITNKEDGEVIVRIQADLPDSPAVNLISSEFIKNGRIDGEFRFKNTSEGVLDYFNKENKPFIIAKYDAKVGDKYVLDLAGGRKVTRTVTKKSSSDDFEWGWYYLKTITVEQDSDIPGIAKIIYNVNHKFGWVSVDVIMEDGSCIFLLIFSSKY